ncbi:hypothetical protein DM02DRAFT_480591, partial [Periconia macrospinosa]
SESESSYVYTPTRSTTPKSIPFRLHDDIVPQQGSVPIPGSFYLIQCTRNEKLLTFFKGQIVLIAMGGQHRTRWECVEKKGWLGFRDLSSYKFLGYDEGGELCCKFAPQDLWESFQVRPTADGHYHLLM